MNKHSKISITYGRTVPVFDRYYDAGTIKIYTENYRNSKKNILKLCKKKEIKMNTYEI